MKNSVMKLEDYVKLPYTQIIKEINDEDGHYFYGRILEFDGCQSTGDTVEELLNNLEEALEEHIALRLKYCFAINEPITLERLTAMRGIL